MSRDTYQKPTPLAPLENINMNLPPPSSTGLKRLGRPSIVPAASQSTYRNSMLPRQSIVGGNGSTRLSMARAVPYARTPARGGEGMPSGGVQRTGSTAARKSIAPTPSSHGRARPSMAGFSTPIAPATVGLGIGGVNGSAAGTMKDARPLRDRGYQARVAQEIYDYLLFNKFEVEMRHPLTQKTLKAPTQKDFVLIFQWLYKRMDPGYKFTKSIEHEVYFVLKTIGYPFLETINKSQISAVGGQNWPVYMGMLHWMVELNMSLEAYDEMAMPGVNSDNLDEPKTSEDRLDQIFIRYISKSYKAFLANEDDYTEYKREMEEEFTDYSSGLVGEIETMKESCSTLEEKQAELLKRADALSALKRKGEALESDLEKFKSYIETMEKRKAKWSNILEKITEELAAAETELGEINKAKEDLQAKIKEQGLLPADIDRINNERENLARAIEKTSASLNSMLDIVANKESQAQATLESLEAHLHKYNTSIYTHSLPTPPLTIDAGLSDAHLGLRPDALLPALASIRPDLQSYRTAIASRIHSVQDEVLKTQDQLDTISEALAEKADTLAMFEAKLHTARLTHETISETGAADTATSHAEVERLSRELGAMEMQANQGLMALNQRAQGIAMEYDALKRNVQRRREEMREEVERMIFQVTDFKVLIQESLEEYENFAVEEWNAAVESA